MKSTSLLLLACGWLAAAEPVLIRNATVLTITKGTLKGDVLVQDGKITAVGSNLNLPAGARVVDASGRYLMPGIIDCHSHIAAEAINEGTVSVSSMVGIQDVLNPEDIGIYRALAGGVTTANVLHGSANSIGGKCSVIKMRWGKTAQELLLEGATPGIKFALGENPKRQGSPNVFSGASLRYPATRMGVEDVIREAFTQARQYQRDWQAYEDGGRKATQPRRDLRLEPLVEVLQGKRFVHAHCYRADEILMLLRVADEFGFKIRTLQHVLEGYKVAKEIAAHGAGASTFSDWWSYKVEAFDAIPYNATLMMRKGILVSLNSDSEELMRHLNTEAGKAVKYGGATEDEALAMITINPARQLAIDNLVGSIEVGKSADLTLYDGHPLSNYSKVLKVWIDGEEYFDRDRDIATRAQKQARRQELLAKQKAAAAEGRTPPPAKPSSGDPARPDASPRTPELPPGGPSNPTPAPAQPPAEAKPVTEPAKPVAPAKTPNSRSRS